MKHRLSNWLAAAFGACLLLLVAPARATTTGADTDLFASTNSQVSTNIIFLVDNAAAGSANASGNYCNIDSSGNVTTTSDTANRTALSGTTLGTLQCALYGAINGLSAPTDAADAKFSIAFMMFNVNGLKSLHPNDSSGTAAITPTGDCSGGDGGCLVVTMAKFNANVKAQVLYWIKNWQTTGNGAWNIKGPTQMANGAMMQEVWAYIKGKTGVSGRDYSSNHATTSCKNFVVFIGNAFSNNMTQGDSTGTHGPKDPLSGLSSTAAKNADPAATTGEKTITTETFTARYNITSSTTLTCTAAGGSSYTISSSENTGSYGLGWARYMFNQHEIRTYSIGYLGSGCKADYPVWLDRLAYYGSAQFFPTNDYATLKAAIETVTGQIISVNSVFASVSLPVSVNTQGSYLNQVYIGMFRPESGFLPRWWGNMKQYKLAFVGSALKLVDADATVAVNSSTGFITECARSYWTPSTVDTYWSGFGRGSCNTISGASESNYPDGNVVEKGANAYMLRTLTPSTRTVKTCGSTMATCAASSDFADFTTAAMSSVSPTLFGLGSSTYTDARDNLINFGRGQNNLAAVTGLQQSDNELTKGANVMRASLHGDVMHSRPVAINYGTDNAPQVVVFYGANDGLLHAVNGNQTTNLTYGVGGTGYSPGQELWSFMPPEFYGSLERLYVNTQTIYYTGTQNVSSTPKSYGMDGPVTAFKGTISGTNKVYAYAAMRRGGRALYAFDVTSPASPTLLWKKGCFGSSTSGTDCSTTGAAANAAYSSIGQTWATAKIIYATAHNSGSTPLLLMAGGYDTCEDTDTGTGNHSCTSSASKGSKVYLIDATNGDIVASFDTALSPGGTVSGGIRRSIIGDPTVVNDSTGKAKYAYMADMGGVVYRLKLSGNATSDWSLTAIAKVGCGLETAGSGMATTTCSANRKFMFQPSVVSTDEVTFWILLGSGDREKPVSGHTASAAVKNYFFGIKDQPETSNWLTTQNATCGENVMCLDSLQKIDGSTAASSTTTAAITTKRGWYLTLSSTEQVVTSAITVFGNTSFSTHMPAVQSEEETCRNNLGTTRVYNINYADASSNNGTDNRYEHVTGDGLPPSPVAGRVLIDGAAVPFCIGCSKDSPLEGKKVVQASSVSRPRNRLYWYIQKN